MFNAPVLPNV